jgi:hypothetical protein
MEEAVRLGWIHMSKMGWGMGMDKRVLEKESNV